MRVSLPMSWPEPLPFRFCQVALYWLLGISHQDLLKPQTSAAGLSFIAGNMKKSVYYIYYCLEFNASILYEGKAFKKSSVRVRSFKSWRAWSTWRWCTTQQTWTWAKKKLWLGFPSQTQGIETWRGVLQISQAPSKLITPPTVSRRGPVVQRSAKPIWRGRCMLHRPRWRLPPIALQELKDFHCCKVATVIVSSSSSSSTTPHRTFCPSSIKYSSARCRGALKKDSQC